MSSFESPTRLLLLLLLRARLSPVFLFFRVILTLHCFSLLNRRRLCASAIVFPFPQALLYTNALVSSSFNTPTSPRRLFFFTLSRFLLRVYTLSRCTATVSSSSRVFPLARHELNESFQQEKTSPRRLRRRRGRGRSSALYCFLSETAPSSLYIDSLGERTMRR